jgi:hypothetical protein
MKRILLLLVLFAGVAAMSYGRVVLKGESNTPFGSYTIEVCDRPLNLAGEDLKCYLITYENYPDVVKVYVDKDRRCKNYVVTSDELSVMYTCNGEFFGVNKVGKKYHCVGLKTDDAKLDRSNYFHQKVILRGGPTEELDAAMLIASYYPALIAE